MIRRGLLRFGTVVALTVGIALPAASWGPDVQRKVTLAALKAVRDEFNEALKGHRDAVEEGVGEPQEVVLEILGVSPGDPLEMQLNRVVRAMDTLKITSKRRISDYSAYRFGVLSQLVADLELPFGIASTAEEERLKEVYEQLLEQNYDSLQYDFSEREFLHYPADNFVKQHQAVVEGGRIIATALNSGQGFNAQVANSSRIYYMRAVNAVADVWYTILREFDGEDPLRRPALTDYAKAEFYTQEVAYLAHRGRGLLDEAAVAYADFESQGQKEPRFHEMMGDAYLDFYQIERKRAASLLTSKKPSLEEVQRAEEINRVAIDLIGARAMTLYAGALKNDPDYTSVKRKGVAYYFALGNEYLEDEKLEEADAALISLLRFDSQYEEGIQLKAQVTQLIQDRNERRARMEEFIAAGDDLLEDGLALWEDLELGTALKTYRKASVFYGLVTNEFESIKTEALSGFNRSLNQIDLIIQTAVEESEATLTQGKNDQDVGSYDDALRYYDQAELKLMFVDPSFDGYDRVKEILDEIQRRRQETATQKAREAAQDDQT